MNKQELIEKFGEKIKLISKDYPYDRILSELWYGIKNLSIRLNLKLLTNTFAMTMASAFISVQVLEVILETLISKS